MSGEWTPVLVVLGAGLVIGLLLAWRLGGRRDKAPPAAADDALRLADLERRRDELLTRLRASENEADRRVLEDQAARVLREIDQLGGGRATPRDRASDAGRERAAAPASPGVRRPMLVGFLGGAAMVSLVSVLIFLALRDAEPDPDRGMPAPAATGGQEHPAPTLPAEVQERLDTLRQQVADEPTDLVARKRLALALLSTEQYVEAFDVTETILAGRPDDPDALYVQGMVRMTMGQDEQALGLLDRVLERYPNHVLALAGRGMIFMRRGDREAAALIWQRALDAAGGSHPDIEQLLAMVRGHEDLPAAPPADHPAVTPPPPAASSAVAPDSFAATVELAPGRSAPVGATLFVFVRQGAEGPPSAVKRVPNPVFPLQVELGPADSMLGRPLPSEGFVSARLDADGSATTRDAGDLEASAPGRLGERVSLVLDEAP